MSGPRPASVLGIDDTVAAGTYVVEIEEVLIPGLTFSADRRVRTSLILPVLIGSSEGLHVVDIDPRNLEEALARDAIAPDQGC